MYMYIYVYIYVYVPASRHASPSKLGGSFPPLAVPIRGAIKAAANFLQTADEAERRRSCAHGCVRSTLRFGV